MGIGRTRTDGHCREAINSPPISVSSSSFFSDLRRPVLWYLYKQYWRSSWQKNQNHVLVIFFLPPFSFGCESDISAYSGLCLSNRRCTLAVSSDPSWTSHSSEIYSQIRYVCCCRYRSNLPHSVRGASSDLVINVLIWIDNADSRC